jgi:hypothetical protein
VNGPFFDPDRGSRIDPTRRPGGTRAVLSFQAGTGSGADGTAPRPYRLPASGSGADGALVTPIEAGVASTTRIVTF